MGVRMAQRIKVVVYSALVLVMLGVSVIPQKVLAQAQADICTGEFRSVSLPLTELGNQTYIRMGGQATNFTGGLYPDGSNQRPPAHEAAGLALAQQIQPLDANGNPDSRRGRIVMLSVGMSNTNAEFDAFIKKVQNDSEVNPRLFFINGALGGQTAEKWVDPSALVWQELDRTMARYQVSANQVQVAWIKQTLTRGGEFPAKAEELQQYLERIVINLKEKFPNLKIVYLSSRTRSYSYERGLSPEPVAFETGFAVKWLVEKQINGDPGLNFDPLNGTVTAPYLTWGPYLWMDGQNPRADGRTWLQEDLAQDCTHPSLQGVDKVADQLYEYFTTDVTAQPWFLANPPVITQSEAQNPLPRFTPIPSATVTPPATTANPVENTPSASGASEQTAVEAIAPVQPDLMRFFGLVMLSVFFLMGVDLFFN